MRADQLLVERQLATSRSQAQRLIAAGVQWRTDSHAAWQSVRKNGDDLPEAAHLQLHDTAESRYVSRGGLKLEGALRHSGLEVSGMHCLDVGQSTGGFTDCLLQHGAAHVTGIDVGQRQIHPRLLADPRVSVHEKTNARDPLALHHALRSQAAATAAAPAFDLMVGDLSFISLTLVLPAVVPYLAAYGHILMLVKPQFELQAAHIGKGGIVKNPAHYADVQERICHCCAALHIHVQHWFDSPITGGDGNREFFIHGVTSAARGG